MKNLLSFIFVFFLSVNVYAQSRRSSNNPGDILLTTSFNFFNKTVRSDVRPNNSENQIFGQLKLGYHIVNGLYAGGLYHMVKDDINSKNTFGVNLTYVYKELHIGGSYLFHSNHKVNIDTPGQMLDAELEKGQGFLIDISYNFPITRSFYLGLGLNYFSVDYGEVDYNDTLVTDSTISDSESYFMPMIRLSYFFGTHGRRIHETENRKRRRSL